MNTLHTDDYYMLRNKFWRQIVPREQRHGMLCLVCMANRLGRPLSPSDFMKDNLNIDESDRIEQRGAHRSPTCQFLPLYVVLLRILLFFGKSNRISLPSAGRLARRQNSIN